MPVTYAVEARLDAAEFADVLNRSGLGARRPMHRPEVIQAMADNADLVVCARDDGLLVGVARSVTDFVYCCYLSDLAVDRAYQRQGIGKELIRLTREEAGGETCSLILLSAPDAMPYYPRIGMARLDNAFGYRRKS